MALDSHESVPGGSGGASPPPHGGHARGWPRLLFYVAGGLLAGVLLVAGLLQIPAVSRAVFLAAVQAAPGVEARAERVTGGWFGGLDVTGLSLAHEGRVLLAAREAHVRYSLPALVAGRIEIGELRVQGLVFTPPPADSAAGPGPAPWDWLTGAAWPHLPLHVARIEVADAQVEGGADSTAWRIDALQLRAHDLRLGGGPTAVAIDTLGLRSSAPGLRTRPATVELAAVLTPMQFKVRTLRVRGGSSVLDAEGTLMLGDSLARPLDDARFTLRAEPLELADLAPLFGAPGATGRIEAAIELAGARPRDWNGKAMLRSTGVTWPGLVFGTTSLEATVEQGRIAWQGGSVVERVPLTTSGWLRAFEGAPEGRAELQAMRLPREWPLLPWEGSPATHAGVLRAQLSAGRLALKARVTGAHDALAAQGTLDLLRAPRYVLRGFTLDRRDRADHVLAGGSLRVDSLIVWAERVPRATLAGGRLLAVDLEHWLPPGAGRATLHARFDGEAQLAARPTARLEVQLEPSTIAGVPAGPGNLRARLTPTAARVTGEAAALSGRVALELGMAWARATPESVLERLHFTTLDLGAWLAPGSHTQLSGEAQGRFRGRALEDLVGDLELSLAPSSLNGIALSGARAQVSATRGEWRADVTARATGGELKSVLTADLAQDPPRYAASGQLPFSLIAHLVQPEPVATSGEARFALRGEGRTLEQWQGTALVTANGVLAGIALDTLHAALRLDDGLVHADTVALRTSAGWLAASGRVAALDPESPASSDLRVRGEVADGPALARALSLDTLRVEGGRFTARVTGPARALTLDGDAHWDALQANGVHAHGGQVTGHAQWGTRFELAGLELRGEWANASAGELQVGRLQASLDHANGISRFEAGAALMGAQHASLKGQLTTDGIELSQFEVGSGVHRWALTAPARVRREGARYTVESFEMRSDSGLARLQGVLDRRLDSDLSLELRDLPLAAWTPLMGRPELSGRIDANLRLSGPAATPRVTGTSTVAIRAPWGPVGMLRTQLGWSGPRVSVQSAFVPAGGSPLSVTAMLPYALSLADSATLVRETADRYDVRITAKSVTLGSLAPLLDPQSFLPRAGTIDADAHFEGTPGAMTGSGHIDVRDADLAIPELGARYRDVQIRSLVERDGLRIVSARAMTGKGTIEAKGVVRLPRLERPVFDLAVTANQFRAADSRDLSALASGNLRLAGEVSAPVITGSLTLQNTSVYITPPGSDTSEVELTPDDWRMLESAFGLVRAGAADPGRQFYEAARLGIDVKLAGDVWVRQRTVPRLEVELKGAFRLDKAPHAVPRLTGRIAPAPDRGYVEQFARRFTFTGGEILLNGDLADHQLDLKTEFKAPSPISSSAPRVVVHLDVQGTPMAIRLILSSEPAMEQSEIVSFIISGQTTRERNASKTGGKANMATALPLQMGLSQITAPLEEFARQKVGLDVVEVRQDGLQGATLVAGRFLDPRLYVGFRQPVAGRDPNARGSASAVRTRIELEYSAYEWLVLNLQGESSRVRSFLRVSHAYR